MQSVSRPIRRSSGSRPQRGLTLIELVVAVTIVSILAAVAVPYAEVTIRRGKEAELRRHLRDMREAIDAFHLDWERGLIPPVADLASIDGYPRSLEVLVDTVRLADGRERRYLRRIPREPFSIGDVSAGDTWRLIAYRDAPESGWSGEDIWDVASPTTGQALNGSWYRDW